MSEATLNGKALLTVPEVQGWFEDAYGRAPSPEDAALLAMEIHHLGFIHSWWRPEFRSWRRSNASRQRWGRINVALAALQKDIPAVIEANVSAKPRSDNRALAGLLETTRRLESSLRRFRRRRGRGLEPWHDVALNLGKLVIEIAKESGVSRAGMGSATSPALKVVARALGYLGLRRDEAAIFEAVKRRNRAIRQGAD